MSLPDYEGKDYFESDQDELEDESPQNDPILEHDQEDAKPVNVSTAIHEENKIGKTSQFEDPIPINSAEPSTNSHPPQSQLPLVPRKDDGVIAEGRLTRPESILNDTESGALDDLLNDYGYTSQPTTPASPTARFAPQTLESKSPPESEDPATSSIYTPNVTNIRRMDVDATAAKEPTVIPTSQPIQSTPQPAKDDDASSFATDVLKSLDTLENPKSSAVTTTTENPPSINSRTQESTSEPKVTNSGPSATSGGNYASSNYWAQMRANLKEKRTEPRAQSNKPADSVSLNDESTKSSSSATRSSNESSRSAMTPATDGRSGSFTSYTHIPKFPDTRRPSTPGLSSPVIPYGRPPRPSIDTGVRHASAEQPRTRSFSDSRNNGKRSASGSPVVGSMPFSNQGQSGSRPSSRNRNREEDISKLPLPVFAPRGPFPEMRGTGERQGRPQSPSGRPPRPMSPGPSSRQPRPGSRPQSPVRSMSPGPSSRQPPRPGSRPQSPVRSMSPGGSSKQPRPQSPSGRSKSPARGPSLSTGPSPEQKARTPSPLKTSFPLQQKDVSLPQQDRTQSPKESVPGITGIQDSLPVQPEVPPKDISLPATSSSPDPSSVSQTQHDHPLSPRPEKKFSFPTVPAINIPPSRNDNIDPISPSRESELAGNDELSPTDKRTTVFLQAAGRRKESQALPPLPPEAPPPPPPSQDPPSATAKRSEHPVEKLMKNFEEAQSPLIPSPAAPVLKSKLVESKDDDSDDDKVIPQQSPVSVEQPARRANAPENLSHVVAPVVAENLAATTSDDRPLHSSPPSMTTSDESPAIQLPELDVSKRMTWGPLSFGSEGPEIKSPMEQVEEESDWEDGADDEPIAPDSAQQVDGDTGRHSDLPAQIEDEDPSSNIDQDQVNTVTEEEPVEEHAEDEEEEVPAPRLDKGKEPEIYHPPVPTFPELETSPDVYPIPTARNKFIDRDVTSFLASEAEVIRESPRPQIPKQILPPIQTQPIPNPATARVMKLDHLPQYMFGKDIPDMSTTAQRIGAYQGRREQMIRADTGLRGWLLHIQQNHPPAILQEPPEIVRLSRGSSDRQPSPTPAAVAQTKKVGRKVISKMKIGGKILGNATKNTMDKLDKLGNSNGDRRGSADPNDRRISSEGFRGPTDNQINSGISPMTSRTEPLPQGEFRQDTYVEPELSTRNPYPSEFRGNSFGEEPVGLGVSNVLQQYPPMERPPPSQPSGLVYPSEIYPDPSTSYSYPEALPYSPTSPSPVISKKEATPSGGRHAVSASMSGYPGSSSTFPDPKSKHLSDSSSYQQPQYQATGPSSPKKSKFSKFMNDLSQSSLTGTKPVQPSHSGWGRSQASQIAPPPPEKPQNRSTSEGSSRLKGFFSDLNSRDITGKPASDRVASAGVQKSSGQNKPSGSFGKFLSDLNKRDLTGMSEEERIAAARRRGQEPTHIPAQPIVYDENASDWEVKLEKMEDVLPHIRKDKLAEALKQAGGDEQRAIGLAVLNSRIL